MTRIQPPPRSLPLSLQIQCLFGGVLSIIGWAFIAFGLVFVRIFAGDITPAELTRWSGELATAPGEITQVVYSNASENERPIQKVSFTYTAAMHTYEGTSYISSYDEVAAGPVTVEHPTDDPTHGRIQGMRSTRFSKGALFTWIFAGIGIGMAAFGLVRGLKARSLLINGRMAEAEYVSRKPTNTRINNRPVYELTFAFDGPMGRQQLTTRTHEPENITDEATERVFYDTGDPSRVVLMDNITGKPVLMPDGNLAAHRPKKALGDMALPALTAVIHLTWTLIARGL